MNFNKLILGEQELHDFENLLLRERIIESAHEDFRDSLDMNKEYNRSTFERIYNKKKLLTFLMLYEKIDATNISTYDFSHLCDLGIIDSTSCLINGTGGGHPTSKIIDNAWNKKCQIIDVLYQITFEIFDEIGVSIDFENRVPKYKMLDLCDSFIFGSQSDFVSKFIIIIRETWKNYIKNLYPSNLAYKSQIYGRSLIDNIALFDEIEEHIQNNIDSIYTTLFESRPELNDIIIYEHFSKNLNCYKQKYNISDYCLNCKSDWKKCISNSEFIYNTNFDCPQRENLGCQKYAKLNGLIMSNTEYATLYDNSLKINKKGIDSNYVIDRIYYIVNVDLSKMVRSLPVPTNVNEALRLREREEIVSFRKIFLEWSQNLYDGNIDEAEYIKKYFDEALDFFEKKKIDSNRKRSLLYCCFEALGNQIPYISNLTGIISPFINRKKLCEEERHKWFLLTR